MIKKTGESLADKVSSSTNFERIIKVVKIAKEFLAGSRTGAPLKSPSTFPASTTSNVACGFSTLRFLLTSSKSLFDLLDW
jgi:hypothetical protein